MLSYRLIERIEENWETLANGVLADVQRDTRTPHYRELADAEIRERAQDLTRNLGYWLTGGNRAQLAARYESLGRRRAAEGVPLYEVLRKLQLLKRRLMGFAREQNLDQTALEIHAENELHQAMDQFFDEVIYSVAKGYAGDSPVFEIERDWATMRV